MDVDVREAFSDAVEQGEVPVEPERRVHAALHEDLCASDIGEFLDLLVDLFVRECVRIAFVALALECTKDALSGADVGVVDVSVEDV